MDRCAWLFDCSMHAFLFLGVLLVMGHAFEGVRPLLARGCDTRHCRELEFAFFQGHGRVQ